MSRRTAESNKAILAAWNKEQELVRKGEGTRDWSPKQQKDIIEKGRAYDDNGRAFEGQHMKSAEMYPEYQGDPGNIQFLTRAEHLEAHNGSWKNPTNWYFNPVTKEKLHFGDVPFIPCDIIDLSEPIINTSVKSKIIEGKIPDSIKEVKTEKFFKAKKDSYNRSLRQTGFAKKIFNKVSIGAIGAIGAILYDAISNSINSDSKDYDFTSSRSNSYSSDNYDDALVDNSGTDFSVERSSPDEHMVKGHGQHYHYKDSSVRFKEKAPYTRGGNKDE